MGLVDISKSGGPNTGGWGGFWWNNWDSHLTIAKALGISKGVPFQAYAIHPWVGDDFDGILGRHQQFHNDMNTALGLQGSDLSVFDPNDPDSVRGWVFSHLAEHVAVYQALNLT